MTAQQHIQIFKWTAILIIAVVLFMIDRGCRGNGNTKPTTDTITVKTDTIWMQSTTDTFYTPQITKTRWRDKTVHDTLETFEYIVADTSLVIQEYFSVNYYEDTVPVKYGNVYIDDTVTENKIISRGIKTDFNIPVAKETITLRQPKRNVAYVGFGAMGSERSFLEQTEISFGFKVKNDKYYGIKGAMSRTGTVLAGIEFKIPIRLNKK